MICYVTRKSYLHPILSNVVWGGRGMGEEGEKSRVDIPTIQYRQSRGGDFPLSCIRLQALTALHKTTWQCANR